MDRALQYISGGVASTALIAGAIAAFISITALVGDTNFPNGSLVQPPGGPHSVRIAEPSQPPAGPIAVAAPPTLTASSPGAVHQLALVGRALSGGTAQSGSGTAGRHAAGPRRVPGAVAGVRSLAHRAGAAAPT